MKEIFIARDFSPTPGGRTRRDGPYSGEMFRNKFLVPAFDRSSEDVVIILDGVAGLPPSFLEEAFGGLVRQGIVNADDFLRRVRFKATDKNMRARSSMIEKFVREAGRVPA